MPGQIRDGDDHGQHQAQGGEIGGVGTYCEKQSRHRPSGDQAGSQQPEARTLRGQVHR